MIRGFGDTLGGQPQKLFNSAVPYYKSRVP